MSFWFYCRLLALLFLRVGAGEEPDFAVLGEENVLEKFLVDVVKELNTTDLILITTIDDLPDLETTSTTLITYNIDEMELDHINDLKQTRIKYNIQPVYLVISPYSSQVLATIDLIRRVDFANTIIAFTEEMTFVYNTYFIRNIGETSYILREVCMYCNAGNDIFEEINRWRSDRGFDLNLKPASSYKGHFWGLELKYQCTNSYFWDDLFKDIFSVLEKKLNFTTKHVKYPKDQNLLAVVNRWAHIGGCLNVNNPTRYKMVDFSYSYELRGETFYSARPRRGLVWYTFIKPFQYGVWVVILISIPICGIVLHLLYEFDFDEQEKGSGDCIWEIFTIMCQDSINSSNRAGKICILFTGYLLGSFSFFYIYTGQLTSFLTTKPFLWLPLDSIYQFRESPMQFLVKEGDYIIDMFIDDSSMRDRILQVPDDQGQSRVWNIYKKRLTLVLENPRKYAIIGSGWESAINQWYTNTEGWREFHYGKVKLSLNLFGFFFPKDSLYQNAFNIQIMRMWESGIMQHLNDKKDFMYFMQNIRNAINENRQPPKINNKIQLVHMTTGFILLCLGYFLSFILFIIEWFKMYNKN